LVPQHRTADTERPAEFDDDDDEDEDEDDWG